MTEYTRSKLKRGIFDNEIDDNLNAIIDRSEWLTDYIDRSLEQAAAREDMLDFATIPLAPLINRVIEITAPILRERGNRLVFTIDRTLPPVLAVEDMLLRVLLNLITNANRHSEGKEIRVTANMADGMAEIHVTDRGSGIPEEILRDIFRRGISGSGGSGLGLPICKEIAETHGGEIKINSGLGIGTDVWFTIPLARG
jgi:signal transduction histidine kinase